MPIDLGLTRVSRLLAHLGNPQSSYNAIHVAGTNGKGSTVAYLSSVFTAAQIRNGRFTSPHMVHYNDCVVINGETYPMEKFQVISDVVKLQDLQNKLGCTEFELLTATAFKIFEQEKVQMAVIEVGLGGRLDATNVLQPPQLLACAITKIGLDHQQLLGSSLAEIAREKAGIIKNGVPVALDATNDPLVLEVVRDVAHHNNSPLYEVDGTTTDQIPSGFQSPLKGEYQKQNLSLALKILDLVHDKYPISQRVQQQGIGNTQWPGRLQSVVVRGRTVLLDGAHNESAAIELGKYLQSTDNIKPRRIFVIAMTKGKDVNGLLKYILQSGDIVVATSFTAPENMPWVKPMDSQELSEIAKNYTHEVYVDTRCIGDIIEQLDASLPVVICGSLYLCADVLRSG